METYFKAKRQKLYEDAQIKIAYYWRRRRRLKIIELMRERKRKVGFYFMLRM